MACCIDAQTSVGLDLLLSSTLPPIAAAMRDSFLELGANALEIQNRLNHLPPETRSELEAVLHEQVKISDMLSEGLAHVRRLLPQAAPGDSLDGVQLREAYPINKDQLIIIAKHSMVEYDQLRFGLNTSQLLEKYKREGVDYKKVFLSHERQLDALAKLGQIISINNIFKFGDNDATLVEKSRNAGLVCAVGGDNHFQKVADLLDGDIPIIGINSDPKTSYGALLNLKEPEFADFVRDLAEAKYRFEPWTRISLSVNGKFIGNSLCEVFLGEREAPMMSRHILDFQGQRIEQKSSGLLASSGAGSSGWFKSGSRLYFPNGLSFSRTVNYLRFENLLISSTGSTDMAQGLILEGETLRIHSLNDSDGIISRDSLDRIPFPRGSVAEIKVAEKPLWVIDRTRVI